MKTALYVLNFLTNTAIIAVDMVIVLVAFKTGQIRTHIVLWTIFLSMAMDVAVYLNSIVHDVPSFFLDTDVFADQNLTYISVLILGCQWFSQLFVLLALSVIHFIAVFSPAKFRTFLPTHIQMINFGIVLIGFLFTVPLLTPYFGYAYMTQGHYWYFDMTKPYTYVYWTLNLILQVTCAIAVACVDTVIIWKICVLRTNSTKKMTVNISLVPSVAPNTATNRGKRISRESRLAIDFVFLSVCFLFMTIVFNVPYQQGFSYEFLMKFASNLNFSKWAIYALGNATIRHGVLRFLKSCQIELLPLTISTVTRPRARSFANVVV